MSEGAKTKNYFKGVSADKLNKEYTMEEIALHDGGLAKEKLTKAIATTADDAKKAKLTLELNALKTFDDAWIVLHNRVYNVTSYLRPTNSHPGGPDILLRKAGTDATEEFENMYHTVAARNLTIPFVIGKVKGTTPDDETMFKEGEASEGGNFIFLIAVIVVLGAVAYTQLM